MITKDKKSDDNKEKEWENPVDPSKPSDDRDKEQVLRQYKEAKRRHDNLTENDDDKKDTEKH